MAKSPRFYHTFPNLSTISTISLTSPQSASVLARNGGPCSFTDQVGELHVLGDWKRGDGDPDAGTVQFTKSLQQFDVSRTQRLAITLCSYHLPTPSHIPTTSTSCILPNILPHERSPHSHYKGLAFIHTLNPSKNPSGIILCPKYYPLPQASGTLPY